MHDLEKSCARQWQKRSYLFGFLFYLVTLKCIISSGCCLSPHILFAHIFTVVFSPFTVNLQLPSHISEVLARVPHSVILSPDWYHPFWGTPNHHISLLLEKILWLAFHLSFDRVLTHLETAHNLEPNC